MYEKVPPPHFPRDFPISLGNGEFFFHSRFGEIFGLLKYFLAKGIIFSFIRKGEKLELKQT